ncbi:hypothetical protein KFE98_19885 [bacterium SCSIO 12741]|nr:hypothetical protein KFE98_19885 [bacterium SCSIO 12741]
MKTGSFVSKFSLILGVVFLSGCLFVSCNDSDAEYDEEYEYVDEEYEEEPAEPIRTPLSLNLQVGDSQTVYVQDFRLTEGYQKNEDSRLGLWGVVKIVTQVYEEEWKKDPNLIMKGHVEYLLNIDPDGTLRMINEEAISFEDENQLKVAANFARGIVTREIRFPPPNQYIQIWVRIGLKPKSTLNQNP